MIEQRGSVAHPAVVTCIVLCASGCTTTLSTSGGWKYEVRGSRFEELRELERFSNSVEYETIPLDRPTTLDVCERVSKAIKSGRFIDYEKTHDAVGFTQELTYLNGLRGRFCSMDRRESDRVYSESDLETLTLEQLVRAAASQHQHGRVRFLANQRATDRIRAESNIELLSSLQSVGGGNLYHETVSRLEVLRAAEAEEKMRQREAQQQLAAATRERAQAEELAMPEHWGEVFVSALWRLNDIHMRMMGAINAGKQTLAMDRIQPEYESVERGLCGQIDAMRRRLAQVDGGELLARRYVFKQIAYRSGDREANSAVELLDMYLDKGSKGNCRRIEQSHVQDTRSEVESRPVVPMGHKARSGKLKSTQEP